MPFFIFDVPQQQEITTRYEAAVQNPVALGAFSPMYSYINGVLLTGSPAPVTDPEVRKAQLWMSGAVQANSGVGPFAMVIREYTQTQQQLHLGRRAPGGSVPGGLQLASSLVATNVKTDIEAGGDAAFPRPPWSLPTVADIARLDARAVGETLFNISGSSAAHPQNAAWAGTVLHPLLGDDQTWRLIEAVEPQVPPVGPPPLADKFDDYRNLFFAGRSYNRAVRSALVSTAYEFVVDPVQTSILPDALTAAQACWISDRVIRGCWPMLETAMRGRAAAKGFAEISSLTDTSLLSNINVLVGGFDLDPPESRIFAQMQSGWFGQVKLPAVPLATDNTSRLETQAFQFFRSIGNNGLTANTRVVAADALWVEAQGSDASALEARQALQGLSNFVVTGSSSPAPSPALADLTPEYLADRRDMLKARVAFDQLSAC